MSRRSVEFSKYEAAGNDFIAINSIAHPHGLTPAQLLRMCNRKTGIGADGVIELRRSQTPDCLFSLLYYNADGKEGSLCGNGSRCSLDFARKSGLVDLTPGGREVAFEACDGVHTGGLELAPNLFSVSIRDLRVCEVRALDSDNYFVDTGSPHHVRFVDSVSDVDVVAVGRRVRWQVYGQAGANVNFAQCHARDATLLDVRTYERGVEDETLACGTGATASSVAAYLRQQTRDRGPAHARTGDDPVTSCTRVRTWGGELVVSFVHEGDHFTDIRLRGPVNHVFDGRILV